MRTMPDFTRVRAAVLTIANHPDYPGKEETIQHCYDDLAEWFELGLLDLDQFHELLRLLMSTSRISEHQN